MTTRSIGRLYDRALAGAGLRAAAYAILSRLDVDGPLTVGELAARLAMERTTCSRELEPLARAGLLTIEVGRDRRQRVVQLSPAGTRRLALGRPHWDAAQERVTAAFGHGNTDDLLARLRALLVQVELLAADR